MPVEKEFTIVKGIQGNKTHSRKKNSDLMLNGTVYMVIQAKKKGENKS